MVVGELQRYLHSLADAVSCAAKSESVVRELRDAADALGAFAPLQLDDFTEFLKTAWRYKMTGELPFSADASKHQAAKPLSEVGMTGRGPNELLMVSQALCDPALSPATTSDQIRREIQSFRHLEPHQLAEVASSLGMFGVPKHRHAIISAVIKHVQARRASAAHSANEKSGELKSAQKSYAENEPIDRDRAL